MFHLIVLCFSKKGKGKVVESEETQVQVNVSTSWRSIGTTDISSIMLSVTQKQ